MTKIPEGERNHSSEPENPYEIFGSIGGEMAREFDESSGRSRHFVWEGDKSKYQAILEETEEDADLSSHVKDTIPFGLFNKVQ